MTKAAVSHLTKCLALEWAPHNITVNAVAPTFIETDGTKKWLDDEDFRDSVVRRIPVGRVGRVEEGALPVVFLASDASSLVTGARSDDRTVVQKEGRPDRSAPDVSLIRRTSAIVLRKP